MRNTKALLAIAALSGALGACEGEDVLVGTARESLHLDVCMGANTECEPDLRTETLVMPDLKPCEAELGPQLEPEYSFTLGELGCPEGAENCSGFLATNLVVASDGTSWVLGVTNGDPQFSAELLLVRISAQGELIDTLDARHGTAPPPENSVLQQRAMVMDERGHVFLLVYEQDGGRNADSPVVERAWLTEYDAEGGLASGPRLFTGLGMPQLAVAKEGTLRIAANGAHNAPRGLLAALDTRGELLWSQNGVRTSGQGVGYGVVGVTTVGDDSFVLADRSHSGDDVTYGLTRFDAEGNAIWDRTFERTFTWARLYDGGDGHVLIVADGFMDLTTWLGRIDGAGEVVWTSDVNTTSALDHGVVLDENRGVALVLVGGFAARPEIVELSLDGGSCTRHPLSNDYNSIRQVAIDGSGDAYVMDGYTLARVRLPAE